MSINKLKEPIVCNLNAIRMNTTLTDIKIPVACIWLSPASISIWWICLRSGWKGELPRIILVAKTLKVSKRGRISIPIATAGAALNFIG
jgi:hypothetical protein